MRKKISFLCKILFGAVPFVLLIPIANAETHINAGDLDNGAVWTASSSPYILESSVNVPFDHALTIEPGVTVEADPSIDPDYTPDISVDGSLFMEGSPDDHITIKGISGIDLYYATATIAYADISIGNRGLYLLNSNTLVSSSTISGAYQGIYVQSGTLAVSDSRIEGNTYGVYVKKYIPVFQAMNHPLLVADADVNFGSKRDFPRGNYSSADHLLAQANNSWPPAVVTISNSSITGNSTAAIKNTEDDPAGTVIAINNWWGSPGGPATSSSAADSNTVQGLVTYAPWLDHDPTRSQDKPKCCSSILFLPGIESSRLYRDEKGILGTGLGWGTSTNTLWEPNRNDDVRKLFLNPDGSSADKTVYSGSAIDNAWGYSVYGKFMKFLDGIVAAGNMNEWSSFGYDWRKPIADVVAGPEKKATTTVSLVETLINMASRSKTGKVTLIAHSNGGLVAKYLTKTLADMGKDNLIDSIISVAVPYLGTPEAIGGILHGDDEALAGGWLLKQSVARQLGQNMSSAYSLLPSAKYFSSSSPVITFASTTPRNINNDSYPNSIASFADESSFVTDAKNIRTAPSANDTESPLEGNKALMASAGSLHNVLDAFSWPAHIARWAILGWNALTTKGIIYHASKADPTVPTHDQVQTNMGDGTVVTASASYDSGTTTVIDLQTPGIKGTLHGNILESVATQGVVRDLLEDSPAAAKEREIVSIPGVSIGLPDASKEKTMIVISTHSPIQPQVYDAQGNHTGETVPPLGMPTDVFRTYDMQISGSAFRVDEHNDTDYDTYISLPDDGTKYSVVLNGTGVGSFTYDVDRIRGGVTMDHAEYANLPVTPLTVATTTIQFSPTDIPTPPGVPFGIASSTFMATIQPLSIDVDGDGTPDIKAVQGSTTNPTTYWESMKKACGKETYCKGIGSRIDRIEDLIKKGKFKRLHDFRDKIWQYLKHRRAKSLSDDDKQKIGDMFDGFISQFE
jgi:pimeloyl-ACP methyl ester carboxylesterase